MTFAESDSKEYRVSINTDDIREATRQAASALYSLVEEALGMDEDEEFELFAHDVLGVLTRHADQLSEGGSPWGQDEGREHD